MKKPERPSLWFNWNIWYLTIVPYNWISLSWSWIYLLYFLFFFSALFTILLYSSFFSTSLRPFYSQNSSINSVHFIIFTLNSIPHIAKTEEIRRWNWQNQDAGPNDPDKCSIYWVFERKKLYLHAFDLCEYTWTENIIKRPKLIGILHISNQKLICWQT